MKVAIYNRDEEVEVVKAPAEVKLSPKAGFYVPAKYRFVFEKEGFSSDEVLVDANFHWWFAANFLTWGFVVGADTYYGELNHMGLYWLKWAHVRRSRRTPPGIVAIRSRQT